MYSRKNLNELLDKVYYKNSDFTDKVVLLRSCLNVATDDEGAIVDDTRLKESVVTIRDVALRSKGLVITGHLGRPEAREKKFSFWSVAQWLQENLKDTGKKVSLAQTLDEAVEGIKSGNIVLVENIRFFSEEESKNDEERLHFAHSIADLGDVFVNDAFADYRQSASTYEVAKLLPSFLGETFYSEITSLAQLGNPKKPFIAVLGGAKLSEKLDSLNALLGIADRVIVGGAMAYTLLKAQGGFVGDSLVEEDKLDVATDIVYKAGIKLVLPVDHMIVEKFEEPAVGRYAFTMDVIIPPGKRAIDIGPKTIDLYKSIIAEGKTILTNGPMGVFEWNAASKGTEEVLRAVVANSEAYTLAGGGDSIAAINTFGISGFDHISTGGGAMLAFLAYDSFPTLDVILDKVD